MTELIKKKTPKYLNLFEIYLPISGKVSFLHRVSGIVLFLFLPLILAMFQWSLDSSGFQYIQAMVSNPIGKIIVLGLIWAYLHHFCAGIRFLFIDLHCGTDLLTARKSAVLVLIFSCVFTVFLWGVLIW